MVKHWVAVMVLLLLGNPLAIAAGDDRVQTDLSEEARVQLFVVPIRIEATKWAKPGECANLGLKDFWLRIRNVPLDDRAMREMIEEGLVAFDRRTRPILHAVVFDTSGSMSLDLPQAKAAASGYLEKTLGDLDKAMVVSFDDSVTLQQRVTTQKQKLLAAIDKLEIGGQTSLYDALVHTIRELDTYRERPVIVLISDGQDNASFYDAEDVIEELQRRPDLTMFAIGIGGRSKDVREMLKRVAESTFGTYFDVDRADELSAVFDEIRGILETEAILSIVDPDPTAGSGGVRVTSKNKVCNVIVLGDPNRAQEKRATRRPIPIPAPPLPIRFRELLSNSHRKILDQGTLIRDDSDCFDPDRPMNQLLSEWEFEVTSGRISGCAPDIALSHGYLYNPGADPFVDRNDAIQIKLRPFDIEIPPFEELEQDPVRLVDAILASLPDGFPLGDENPVDRETVSNWFTGIPMLVHGTTFLEMRPRLARALMLHPVYGEWAMGRLQEWIEADIQVLERRYRALFPDRSDETVRSAAHSSDEAKAIRARLEAPTEVDVQPFLAAWLGDIESHTLFSAWEREAVRRRLAGEETAEGTETFLTGWRRLRALLSKPSTTRIVAPLVLMYEPECDCVGFYRIILPRPGLIRARVRERSDFLQGPRLDIPPKLPFGYGLIGALQEQFPRAVAGLRDADYRLDSIRYELLGPPEFHDPERAFRETRVRVDFLRASPASDQRRTQRVEITADLHLAIPPPRPLDLPIAQKLPPRRPRWLLDSVEVDVRHDPELKELFGKPNEALAGYELLKGSAQPIPDSSRNGSVDSISPGP